MSNPPAAVNKRDEPGANPGEDSPQADQRPATGTATLKLSKTREVFLHFEIGFKRTSPKVLRRAAEVQAPQIEPAVPQPVLAFSAGAPRQAAPALDAGAAPQASPAVSDSSGTGGSVSSRSRVSVYVVMKAGSTYRPETVSPPAPYPPPSE
jgi:hypothetical protein